MLRYKLLVCALMVASASAGMPKVKGPSEASMQAAVDHVNNSVKQLTDKLGNRMEEVHNMTASFATGPERRQIFKTPEFVTPSITIPAIANHEAPVLPEIPFGSLMPKGKGSQVSEGKGGPTIHLPKNLVPEIVIPKQRLPFITFGKAAYRPGSVTGWKAPKLGLTNITVPGLGKGSAHLPTLVIPTHAFAMKPVEVPQLALGNATFEVPVLQHKTAVGPSLEMGNYTLRMPTAKLATTSFEVPVVGTATHKTPSMVLPVLVPRSRTIFLPRLTHQQIDLVMPHSPESPEVSGKATKQLAEKLAKMGVNVTEHAKGKGKLPDFKGLAMKNVTWHHWENKPLNVTHLEKALFEVPAQTMHVPVLGSKEVILPYIGVGKGAAGKTLPMPHLVGKNMTIPTLAHKSVSMPFPEFKQKNMTMPVLVKGGDFVIPGAKVPALEIVGKTVLIPVIKHSRGPIVIVPPKMPFLETVIEIPAFQPHKMKWPGSPSMRWKKLTPLGAPTVQAEFPGAVITGGGKGSVNVDVPAGGGMVIAGKGSPLLNVTVPAYSYNSRGAAQKGAGSMTMPTLPKMPNFHSMLPSMPAMPSMPKMAMPSMTMPKLPEMQHPKLG